MAPNTKLRSDDSSERQTENSDDSECQRETMMTLNAKTENDDGSERHDWKVWMPNWK